MSQRRYQDSVRYVYCEYYSAFGRKAGTAFHRIIHSTATTLYIDSGNEYLQGWRGFSIPLVIKLNRAELENEGRAWSKSQRRFYYASSSPASNMDDYGGSTEEEPVPDFVKPLGLSIPFSIEDVEAAFRRKAKHSHPDLGGNSEDFILLRQVYERALAFFNQS